MITSSGFNLVNTEKHMNIHLELVRGFSVMYGKLETVDKCGFIKYKINDVTKFEECHKELMSKFDATEKRVYHVNIKALKLIHEVIKSIDEYDRSQVDKKLPASSHRDVIAEMDRYIRVIRLAFSKLYYHDDYACAYKSLKDVLTREPSDFKKFVFMTDKGDTLDEKKDKRMEVYGTVEMFIDDFCINPMNFSRGISYDGICKCIRNIYDWVSRIVEAYVVLNVPDHYVISYESCYNGDNFIECSLSASMEMGNAIDSIVQYPIDIISQSHYHDDIVDQDMETRASGFSWEAIDDILDGYGF